MSKLKIGAKLGLSFLVVVLLTAAVGAFAVSQLSRIHDNTEDLGSNWLASIEAIGAIRGVAGDIRRAEAQHALAVDADDMRQQEARLKANGAKIAEAVSRYEPLISSDKERQLADRLKGQIASYLATSTKLIALSSDPTKERETRELFGGESRSKLNEMLATGDQLAQLNSEGARAARESANATFASSRAWLVSLVLAAMAAAALMALWITRMITRPVARAVDAADRIAAGDLTVELATSGRDEIARLLQALAAMRANLSGIVSGVRENAEGVAIASAQIAQGNNDLSGRTEEQASALEETAASMEQLSSAVKQNADNAREANELAARASTVATQGGDAVEEVVETMREINASSKRITDIIATIDGIAFQTNILALNAAVEAARAGEQGRGFAVVATEVRGLARRSAEAAKEIKTLISASVERVEKGSTVADQAGATMREVVSSIRRVADIMGEISAASAEQSAGVAQIGEAVAHMDQATQQNAALVEESAAAAESLKGQAKQLVDAVAVFAVPSTRSDGESRATGAMDDPREPTGARRAAQVSRLPARAASARPEPSAPSREERKRTGTDDWEAF